MFAYGANMGFNNPGISWGELERRLSDRPQDGRVIDPLAGDGGDSPAWSRKRAPYSPPPGGRHRGEVPYAELHCHSNFSFLDGASHPEELAEEAARLGLEALALTDHNGFYGVVRFSEAAKAVGLPTIFGAELTLAAPGITRRRWNDICRSHTAKRPRTPSPAACTFGCIRSGRKRITWWRSDPA